VGKSSSLWKYLADRGEAPLFVNAEELLIRQWCTSPTTVAADLGDLLQPGIPVLLEEAQHLEEAGLLIKGLVDTGVPNPLYVTGSSSFHLRSRTRESLAGRAARLQMHPLSMIELAAVHAELTSPLKLANTRETALRHMIWGGYPEVWTSDSPASVLGNLVEAHVMRDASDLYRIDRLDAFRRLIGLLAGQVGQLVNATEWASACGVTRTAIANYLDILEETHIVRTVRPFAGGRRAELTSRPKVFFADNGILSSVLAQFGSFDERVDRGAVLENWVGAELGKRVSGLAPDQSLRFWRSKSGAEVDFVLERGGAVFAFEVKATKLRRPKLSRSARSFIDAYRPQRFHVVNLELSAADRLDGTEVIWTGPEAMAEPGLLDL
jgi:predicted AAA+ superfamily ATPase